MTSLYRKSLFLKSITLLCVCSVGGCSTYTSKDANPAFETQDRIDNHIYAGTGIGPSWMEPDASEVSSVTVNDRVETGGQITIGMDLSRQLALELHSADLGSAGLSPGGRINYHIHGASALLYVGKNRHRYRRHGLTGYGRVGLGYLENTVDGDVEYIQVNSTHLLTGAGVEYMTRMGLGFRAEGILYEQDARYAQLGIIYRTGRRAPSKPIEIVQLPEPAPVVAPIPAVAVVKPPAPVDSCSDITGVLEGVNFRTNSFMLRANARSILDKVATRLLECDSVPVRITAHTDSIGEEDYNQGLSERRAASVVKFLSKRGIDTDRLKAEAFGETKPLDTNKTREGRKRNRRVELVTVE